MIKELPGVIGCVILTDPVEGNPEEIQAFVQAGTDRTQVQEAILEHAAARGLRESLRQVLVFELQTDADMQDRDSLHRAAEVAAQEAKSQEQEIHLSQPAAEAALQEPEARPAPTHRPRLRRVHLGSTAWRAEAEVGLGGGAGGEVSGHAAGEKTPHGLSLLAKATADAAAKLVEGMEVQVKGASLVTLFEREAVLVLLQVAGSPETIGAALVRDAPMPEAAVRATLDGLNRLLSVDG